jgi:ribosome-binding factor A
MTTHRSRRVADLIREVVADVILHELRDPRIGVVTVTEVRLPSDLKDARVFVSCLGDAEARETAVDALNHAAPFLRRALGRRVRLKYVPQLTFVADMTLDRGERLESLLREIRDERPEEPDPEDDG